MIFKFMHHISKADLYPSIEIVAYGNFIDSSYSERYEQSGLLVACTKQNDGKRRWRFISEAEVEDYTTVSKPWDFLKAGTSRINNRKPSR